MENQVIKQRLQLLRAEMEKEKIDYYLIPTADFHNSEYVNEYFKARQYFSNFSGSAGTLLVWKDGAGLWTDGRYFIQAEKELAGTGITLFRMLDEGVPTIVEFMEQNIGEGQALGFDGRVVSMTLGQEYEEKLGQRYVKIVYEKDLADRVWVDRPSFPNGVVSFLTDKIAGKSFEEKREQVMERVREAGAEELFITKLDDIMWLTNLRGCDVQCNPVAMSYVYLTADETILFIGKSALEADVVGYLLAKGIRVLDYSEVSDYLSKLSAGRKVMIDKRYLNYSLYKILSGKQTLVEADHPTELLKAIKNPTELANMEEIYLKDSIALTKFIHWLKTHIGKEEITEITAADKLEAFRREVPEFLDLSFTSISAYGANAAMMHYAPTPENFAVLKPEGMYLIDSGGQYLGGTTDVTRTIVLGKLTEREIHDYTLVAAGMLQLTNAKWLYGCTGRNLDILARQPIWNADLDFKCGTGHGVGYILNVHEGPQGLRWRYTKGQTDAVIEAGMDITNEPGVYIEGSHGVRIENVMVAENGTKNEYGQFMHFKTLTWVPIDMEAVDLTLLSSKQKEYLVAYQATVYEKLSPYLDEEERQWLAKETEVKM